MVLSSSTSANLSRTITHAVSFLTSPLAASYPAAAVNKLRLVLEANLAALYAPTWVVKDPLSGSDRRSIRLSPGCLPPGPIYSACIAASVQWFEWIFLLGDRELELFVNPGHVAVRYGPKESTGGQLLTVWWDQPTSSATRATKPCPSPIDVQQATRPKSSKTVAQQILEEDRQADEQLFAMIADEINAPTWVTPIDADFPSPSRPLSPSTVSAHSRCSSRSSNSSSGFSFTSAQSSSTSLSSVSVPGSQGHRQSRREKGRHSRIFVDTSRVDVTPYDGGKTTVLTGGVMLGAAQRRPTKANAKHTW